MPNSSKPSIVAIIREDACIGCTKCILACPVDAILGAANFMHTVIAEECIGCKLCISPCPVDCIEMIETPAIAVEAITRSQKIRQRSNARKQRLAQTGKSNTKDRKERLTEIAAAVQRRKTTNYERQKQT